MGFLSTDKPLWKRPRRDILSRLSWSFIFSSLMGFLPSFRTRSPGLIALMGQTSPTTMGLYKYKRREKPPN